MKRTTLLMFCLTMAAITLKAQVGINTEDPQATLHVMSHATNSTTSEGIIAPNLTRAQVIGKDAQYGAAQKGAYVYITSVDGTETVKTAHITTTGYYFFNGDMWQPMDYTPEFLYLPSFNLPMPSVSTGLTYDLYTKVYKAQFSKSGNNTFVCSNPAMTEVTPLYNADQLDFIVLNYDNTVLKVNSISPAGVINYDVLDTDPGNTFINIALVVKR